MRSANWSLVDAQALHEENPHTFEVPNESDLNDLIVSDFIKVGFQHKGQCERIWVKIERIDGENLYCTLANSPVFITMKLGDMVVVHRKNVMDCMSFEELLRVDEVVFH